MAGHFDAVGFEANDAEELEDLIRDAYGRARADGAAVEHAGGLTLHYVDPSGAALAIHVDRDGEFLCCQPGYAGQTLFRWRPLHVVPDPDDCRYCDLVLADLLDGEGEMIYPFALTIETMGAARERIPYGEAGEVTFAALLESGEAWESEEAFSGGRELEIEPPVTSEGEPDIPGLRGFAAQSLVPIGTFSFDDSPMTSRVLAHGVVAGVEERRNELGGGEFAVVRLDTLGGTFDVCLAPQAIEREELLAPGAVLGGTFWLVGRPVTLRDAPGPVPEPEPEPEREPEQRRRLGRFFGRRRG